MALEAPMMLTPPEALDASDDARPDTIDTEPPTEPEPP